MQKYSKRHGNRVKDFLHKLTTRLANKFKEEADNTLMSYKASVRLLDPHNSTKTCPRCCGKIKHREGQVLECSKCSLRINRQLNASISPYLRMWGFPPPNEDLGGDNTPKPEKERGVTLNGGETDDILPMNPEGVEVDVPQGLHGH